MGVRKLILPIGVQRHYTTWLHGSLPLCVILSAGFSSWFERRFVGLWAVMDPPGRSVYSDVGRLVPFVDFGDAWSYDEVLWVRPVYPTDAADIGDTVAEFRRMLDGGEYLVVNVDEGKLRGNQTPYYRARHTRHVHPLLVYGYDDGAAEFLAIGFDRRMRFSELRFGYRPLAGAYEAVVRDPPAHDPEWTDPAPAFTSLRPKEIPDEKPVEAIGLSAAMNDYFAERPCALGRSAPKNATPRARRRGREVWLWDLRTPP